MAVANVAWILAANGHRVLVSDWDLESPGLHRFLYPFLDRMERGAPGVIELIRAYDRLATPSDTNTRLRKHIPECARVEKYAFTLNWSFPGGGTLDFLPAGQQNVEYVATLGAMDWGNFYTRLNGGEFLDALRADMKDKYDYTLIDSRTGLTDVADICTVQLPDILVDCFTLSTQGIEGAERMARRIQERYPDHDIRVLPVPMRVSHPSRGSGRQPAWACGLRHGGAATAGFRFRDLGIRVRGEPRRGYRAGAQLARDHRCITRPRRQLSRRRAAHLAGERPQCSVHRSRGRPQ
jgi:hypothetical protein